MKFNDISNNTAPAEAAREALLKQSIVIEESVSGSSLRDHLGDIQKELDTLASKGGAEYTRAVLHKAVYEDMANVDAEVIVEAEFGDDDIEQAEIIIAATGMSKEFQDMIEDSADMLGSDLITLVDQIKSKFGDGAGEQFGTAIRSSLQSAMDVLTTTKDGIDAAISQLKDPMSAPVADPGMEPELGDDVEAVTPAMSGPEEEPLGRELKSELE
jgi:hypothetical protein